MNSVDMLDQQLFVGIGQSSVNCLQPEEMDSLTDELIVRVRKPYTISKQREKWTDEEHEKFLEALKLYGRAWRRIKEHIGTKTAIQIRSHAQKFFSKVLNEPITGKTIEIPPPRPKRKPLHPYPRKLARTYRKGLSVVVQQDEPSLRIPSISEQESGSPVSVLSAVGSKTMVSPYCTSPISSTVRRGPDEPVLTEHESGYSSPTVSNIEDGRTSSFEGTMNAPIKQDQAQMELDLHSEDNEAIPRLGQSASFKLFGNIVSVNDSYNCQKENSCVGDPQCLSSSSASNHEGPTDRDVQIQLCASSRPQEQPCVVPDPSAQSQWLDGVSPVYYLFAHNCDSMNLDRTAIAAPLPVWWSLYGNPPFQSFSQLNMCPKKDHTKDTRTTNDGNDQKEDSSTGSNSDSIQGSGNENAKCIVVDSHVYQTELPHAFKLNHSENSAFALVKTQN